MQLLSFQMKRIPALLNTPTHSLLGDLFSRAYQGFLILVKYRFW